MDVCSIKKEVKRMNGKRLIVSVTTVIILLLLPTVSADVSEGKKNSSESFEINENKNNNKISSMLTFQMAEQSLGFGEFLFALIYILFLLLGIVLF